jgi:hypothetical protein
MFGGRCPSCLGDIPGDEAPTDPGEAVKRAQAQRDARTRRQRKLIPVLISVPIVLLLGVVAVAVVLRPEPEIAVIDFDLLDYPMPELVARAPDPVPVPPPATTGGAGGAGAAAPAPKVSAAVARVDEPKQAAVTAAPIEAPSLDLGLNINAERRSEVYTDPEQITAMIYKLMTAQVPRLNACYEQRLRVDETLQGRWRIAYTVEASGAVSKASATGLGRQDADFEACLARTVAGWKFDRIAAARQVQRSLTFRK